MRYEVLKGVSLLSEATSDSVLETERTSERASELVSDTELVKITFHNMNGTTKINNPAINIPNPELDFLDIYLVNETSDRLLGL